MSEDVTGKAGSSVPLSWRMRRLVRRIVPFGVWLAAASVVVMLYSRHSGEGNLTGFATDMRFSVAPETGGRIERLEVELNAAVEKGQVVAILDDRELLLRLSRARAELNRLESDLARESNLISARETPTEFETASRRFLRDIEQGHIDYLRALADQQEDRVRLQGLELRLERSKSLSSEDVAPVKQLEDDRTARDALSERIKERVELIKGLKERHTAAKERYARFLTTRNQTGPDKSVLLKPLEYAVRVQELRLEQFNLEVTRLVVRAPVSGRVARVVRRTGEVVTTGDTIVQLIEPRSHEVVAYLPEQRLLHVWPGMRVELERRADPGRVLASEVREIGSRVVRVPDRAAQATGREGWGVSVHIPLPGGLMVTPGEAFEIRLLDTND